MTARPLVHDVRVDHRRRHVGVAEEFLHRADVVAALQHVRGERVAQRVAAHRLHDACRGLYTVDGITMWLFEPADVEQLRVKIKDAERGKLFIR